MSWGISDSAPNKEKIKSEINDCLCGLNSCGKIDYLTYDKLYDYFISSLDKMADIVTSACDDICYVIYNKVDKVYYYGLNKWGNQVRNAKCYHSKKYLLEAIDMFKSEAKSLSCIKAKSDLENLVVRELRIIVYDTISIEDFKEKEIK